MAAIVLPDGDHLTWVRLLVGVSMMILVPLAGGLTMRWWDTRPARRNPR